jgi:hypothetical protein
VSHIRARLCLVGFHAILFRGSFPPPCVARMFGCYLLSSVNASQYKVCLSMATDVSLTRKHYFICPPKCGVFVAAAKLSAPTVGVGTTSRPTSVASSRGGRVTPSYSSGRITPSNSARYTPYSNGRVTPASSTSRALLEAVTPSARPRIKTAATSFNGKYLERFAADK